MKEKLAKKRWLWFAVPIVFAAVVLILVFSWRDRTPFSMPEPDRYDCVILSTPMQADEFGDLRYTQRVIQSEAELAALAAALKNGAGKSVFSAPYGDGGDIGPVLASQMIYFYSGSELIGSCTCEYAQKKARVTCSWAEPLAPGEDPNEEPRLSGWYLDPKTQSEIENLGEGRVFPIPETIQSAVLEDGTELSADACAELCAALQAFGRSQQSLLQNTGGAENLDAVPAHGWYKIEITLPDQSRFTLSYRPAAAAKGTGFLTLEDGLPGLLSWAIKQEEDPFYAVVTTIIKPPDAELTPVAPEERVK